MGHDAAKWLRRRNVGLGQSPIGFLLSRANGLAEMHDLLLREAGQC
nr:antitoxin Xre/MbcA/ParS toxin-binding domain-containing protein [Sphingomonas tagetis]